MNKQGKIIVMVKMWSKYKKKMQFSVPLHPTYVGKVDHFLKQKSV